MRRFNLLAAFYEAALLGIAATLGLLLHSPLVFTSLGPTAYELIETPNRPSAKPYNIVVGHAIGIVSGLIALAVTHAWSAPPVSVHGVPALRIGSVVVAGLLTVGGTLACKATQPASLSTTLLIALGTMQTERAVLAIAAGVILITAIGEPLRRMRSRTLASSS